MAEPSLRHARAATALMFFMTGAIFAAWAVRIPAMKQDLGISDGQLGMAFAGMNAGAILGLQAGGLVVTRFGSMIALRVAMPVFGAALLLPAVAGRLASFVGALFVWAAINSVIDVAMNAQGVLVEGRYGRPVLSSLHAMHSAGGIAGAATGFAAARAEVGLSIHFAAVAIVTAILAVVFGRILLPGGRVADRPSAQATLIGTWPRRLVILGAVAFCLTLVEGSALDWSAVYVHDVLRADHASAGVTVIAFMAAMTFGRLLGDRITQRYGAVASVRAGCLIGCGGLITALAAPTPFVGMLGFGVLGLGLSYTLPIAISAAGAATPNAASAVARVSTLAYAGSFVGPWLIGGLADQTDLSTALMLPAALILLAALLMRSPDPKPTSQPRAPDREHKHG